MKALGLVVSEEIFFLCFTHDPPPQGGARMDPSGTVDRIYKKDHYTLLQTKYESFGSWFRRRGFFKVFPMAPRGGARMDPRGTVGRFYKEDHYTLLLTRYENSGPCGFRKEDLFLCFSH